MKKRSTRNHETEKKKKKSRKEESSSCSSIGLVDDVLTEILMRLPATSVLRFRSVCKSWCLLTVEQSFVRIHTRRLRDRPKSMIMHPCPFVVSPQRQLQHLCRVDTDDDDRIVERSIEIRSMIPDSYAGRELLMRVSCDGLLCFAVAEGPKPYFICNPITRTWTAVEASPNQPPRSTGICLKAIYFHGSTGEYRLLQYFSKGESAGYEVVTVNGSGSWRTVYRLCYPNVSALARSGTEMDRVLAVDVCWYNPVVTNGSLHWLLHGHSDFGIVVFDTESEEFGRMPIPPDSKPQRALQETLLYKIDEGKLCVALRRYVGGRRERFEMELWVLKNYRSVQWMKMHTIILRKKMYCRMLRTSVDEEEEEEEHGKLFMRWGLAGEQFSHYNFRGVNVKRFLHDALLAMTLDSFGFPSSKRGLTQIPTSILSTSMTSLC